MKEWLRILTHLHLTLEVFFPIGGFRGYRARYFSLEGLFKDGSGEETLIG